MKYIIAAIALVFLAATGPVRGDRLAGTASVTDGDTIAIHGHKIRLHGIDSPEGRQRCSVNGKAWRCGTEASNALAALINRNPVSCRVMDIDRYKRLVARCSVRGIDINDWMVRNGWALAYRQYSKDYIGAEEEAEQNARGIWQGEFEAPWSWRKHKKN